MLGILAACRKKRKGFSNFFPAAKLAALHQDLNTVLVKALICRHNRGALQECCDDDEPVTRISVKQEHSISPHSSLESSSVGS